MVLKCGACGQFMSKGGVVCTQCKSHSHSECIGLLAGAKIAETWRCGECQRNAPSGRDYSTPVRGAQVQDSPVARENSPAARDVEPMTLDDTAHNTTAEFSGMELLFTELRSFRDEVRTLSSEMREFRMELADVRGSIAGVNARMNGFEERLEAVERRGDDSSPEVAALQCRVTQLQQELNDRDQEALLADLEIGHLPEEKGESAVHAVLTLAAKLGVALEARDVVFAERVGAGAAGEAPRARRLVVRLARRELRDQMLQGARVRRTLTASDAGGGTAAGGSGGRIFLNERLTRTNRQLFYRVREECRRLQWRYSWTKRGRIYARQADGKPAFPIQSVADLSRVFGSTPV